MKPLATTRTMFTLLCIYPVEKPANRWKKMAFICFSAFVFSVILSLLFASALYVIKYLKIDLTQSLYSLQQIIAWLPIFYMYIIALIKRKKITTIFTELTEIYIKCKYFLNEIYLI